MIFYFTGTGNSLFVAKELSKALGERLVSIADELKKPSTALSYSLQKDERILFVYPVHSWGVPILVDRFIGRLQWVGYDAQSIYSVCTCGDECGYTSTQMQNLLLGKGCKLTHAYSVIMPNNYILMPGFTIDTPEVEQQKLAAAPARIHSIADSIQSTSFISLYHTGSMPFLKSRLIYPLFVRFGTNSKPFHSTEACISCGLCASLCPSQTITMVEGRPVWSNSCVQCSACIHRCPVRAIEYGKITQRKGRYCYGDGAE